MFTDLIILLHRAREADGAAVAFSVNGADAEEVVVLGHALHRVARHVSNHACVGPDGRGGFAPDDFVAR